MPNQFGPTFIDGVVDQLRTGATTSYVPTVDQGVTTDIATTINYAQYFRIGNFVVGWVSLSFTGVGTAGSAVTVDSPTTFIARTNAVFGTGLYFDSGTATYPLLVRASGTTGYTFSRTDDSSGQTLGSSLSLAIANGDAMQFFFVYEAA